MRQALLASEESFTYDHEYTIDTEYGSQPGQTTYAIDLRQMTSTNPDSGTTRRLRVVAVVMWTD